MNKSSSDLSCLLLNLLSHVFDEIDYDNQSPFGSYVYVIFPHCISSKTCALTVLLCSQPIEQELLEMCLCNISLDPEATASAKDHSLLSRDLNESHASAKEVSSRSLANASHALLRIGV